MIVRTNLSNSTPIKIAIRKAELDKQRRYKHQPDLLPAAEKLGYPLPLLSHLSPALAHWTANDFAGPTHEEAMKIMLATPCEKRSMGGRCEASGCGKTPDKTTYCVWLIRMGELCPAKKW